MENRKINRRVFIKNTTLAATALTLAGTDAGHRAQGTGRRAQGKGHRTQDTGHRAQGTGHRELSVLILTVTCCLLLTYKPIPL
jgi:hypothetical protein